MRRVVSSEEMRWCDETAVKSFGIPSLLLMENAGAGVGRSVVRRFGHLMNRPVAIFCGKGNNGGDGFVAARHLLNAGAEVVVLQLFAPAELKGDARTNFRILQKIQKRSGGRLLIRRFGGSVSAIRPSVIVDAMFGTGFNGSPKGAFSRAIEWINRQDVPVLSVDIPSGVNGTTGIAGTVCVHADVTATMGTLKAGLLLNDGKNHSGEHEVVDIGIPASVFASPQLKTALAEMTDIRGTLPSRSLQAHKYSVGKVFVLAGSRGFTGAAALTASAALRAGAGAVVLGTPEPVYPILAKKLSETIVFPLPATPEGTLSSAGFDAIMERVQWADSTVIGPGLSRDRETVTLLMRVLKQMRGKVVLDADGLNALGKSAPSFLRSLRAEVLVTPHTGEFSRMSGVRSDLVEGNRIDHARTFSKKAGCLVILKGAPTVTALPDGETVLNATGNPGMATVGSGDVLSGIIGALWAQGMTAKEAGIAGVYLHGLSGDLAGEELGLRSIVAQDLIDFLPASFRAVGEAS